MLNDEYLLQIVKLEELVKNKKDYEKYSSEEKTNLVYTCFLAKTMKSITKIDVLLKRGNLYVFNTMDLRESMDQVRKLFPEDDLSVSKK